MNIYEKVQKIKIQLLECNLKKTGQNKYSGFEYYELSDIMPDIIRLCEKNKVCTQVNFEADKASLRAVDCEDTNGFIEVATPTEKLEIKGSNAVQALGGMQTYMRRYLYMAMFDITENDMFDAVSGKTEKTPKDKKYFCNDCGSEFKGFTHNGKTYTAGQAYHMSEKKSEDGKARCKTCREKLNNKGEI